MWSLTTGTLAAAVALYGRYRDLPGMLTGPATCQMEGGGCQALFRNANAAVMGVPKSALGLLCYVVMAIGWWQEWPAWMLVVGATGALVMSIKLGLGLIARGLQCRICWMGHYANAVLWICLVVKWVLDARAGGSAF